MNLPYKYIIFFLVCLSAASFATCQSKQERAYIANIYAKYTASSANGSAQGSQHVNLYIRNTNTAFDTVTIRYANQNFQLRIKPLGDTLLSLPKDVGMLQSAYNGKYLGTLSPFNPNSAFYGTIYNNDLVWITKSETTEVALRDSSYYSQYQSVDTRSYYLSTTMHGFATPVFGHSFTLSTWGSHNFTIVAQEDNTPIDITFKRKHYDSGILRSYPKERFYLNKGQSLEYSCEISDVTGTLIEAPNPCKPAMVFYDCGDNTKEGYFYNNVNTEIGLGCNQVSSWYCESFNKGRFGGGAPWKRHGCYNYTFLPPHENANYRFIVPSKIKGTANFVEVQALYNNTLVYLDGNLVRTLKKDEFYFAVVRELTVLEASEPVTVQYFSKFQGQEMTNKLPYIGQIPNYSNRWARQPVMAMEDGKTQYQVYIPYSNKKGMVNMECVLQKVDTLYNEFGVPLIPNYTHTKGELKSISFALDSGWHQLTSPNKFLAWFYYFVYESPLTKNGTKNIFLDSMTDDNYGYNEYGKTHLASVAGEMLGYNPKRRAHSIRVNEVLYRDLGADSFYTVCQQSPVKLWGRADFYKASKSYWVVNNKDTLQGAMLTYQFIDTGMHKLTFFTEKMDTLCSGSFGLYIDSTQFHVKVNYKPKVYLPKDTIVCKGTVLTITAVSEKDTTLSWSAGGAFISNDSYSITIKADTSLAIVTSITHLGCSPSTDTMLINLYDSITVQLPIDTLLCYGQGMDVSPTVTGGDSSSYQYKWQNDSASFTTKYTVTKDTLLILTVTDKCLAVNSNLDSMLIMAGQPIITKLQSDSTSCNGQLSKVVAHSTGGNKPLLYNWNNTGFTTDSTFVYNKLDTLTLTCVISDNCSTNDTQTIVLKPHAKTILTKLEVDSLFCKDQRFSLFVETNGSAKDSSVFTLTSPSGKQSILKGFTGFTQTSMPEVGKWTVALSNTCSNTFWDTSFNVVFPVHQFSYKNLDTFCEQGLVIDYSFTSTGTQTHQYEMILNNTTSITNTETNGAVSLSVKPQLGANTLAIRINDGCDFDSIITSFTVYPPVKLNKKLDTVICSGDLLTLQTRLFQGDPNSKVGFIIDKIRYNANDEISLTDNQLVYVEVEDNCSNKDVDTFLVHVVKPLKDITLDPLMGCTPLTITGKTNGLNTADIRAWWINPKNNQTALGANFSMIIKEIGTHIFSWQTITTSGKICTDTSIKVAVYPVPIININISPALPEVNSTEIQLKTNASVQKYSWYINDTLVSSSPNYGFIPTYAGTYNLKLIGTSKEGCTDSATNKIEVLNTNYAFLPNAFSPNGDGMNDVWAPIMNNIVNAELYIYDRWGGQVYHQNNPTISWDGKYKNQIVPQGYYVYVIFIKTVNNEKQQLSGQVLLLR